jgi:hypothetical protein
MGSLSATLAISSSSITPSSDLSADNLPPAASCAQNCRCWSSAGNQDGGQLSLERILYLAGANQYNVERISAYSHQLFMKF